MDTWVITNQTHLQPTHGGREYHNPKYIHAITSAWLWFVNHFRGRGDIQGKILDIGSILILDSVYYNATSCAFSRCFVGFNDGNAPGAVLKENKAVFITISQQELMVEWDLLSALFQKCCILKGQAWKGEWTLLSLSDKICKNSWIFGKA